MRSTLSNISRLFDLFGSTFLLQGPPGVTPTAPYTGTGKRFFLIIHNGIIHVMLSCPERGGAILTPSLPQAASLPEREGIDTKFNKN
jgi:hypothetical protein